MASERLFLRLPPSTRPGDAVVLPDGRRAIVDTARLAEDLRDAKCTVIAHSEPDSSERRA